MKAQSIVRICILCTLVTALASGDMSGTERIAPPRNMLRTVPAPVGQAPRRIGGTQVPVVRPAIAVDGAKTPDAIPDAVAYKHFIMAAAAPEKPTPKDAARRDGYLTRVGLAAADRAAVVASLRTVREGLDAVARDRNQLPPDSLNSIAVLAALKGREDDIVDSAQTRLRTSLTRDGWNRLDAYIRNQVKKRIRIYGDSPR